MEETESSLTFSKHVTVPGGANKPSFEFLIESEEFFPDGAIVPFFAKYPVLHTTLTVLYPIDQMDVFVDISIGHLDEPAILDDRAGKTWKFGKPMLPGQGFSVRFATKRARAGARSLRVQ